MSLISSIVESSSPCESIVHHEGVGTPRVSWAAETRSTLTRIAAVFLQTLGLFAVTAVAVRVFIALAPRLRFTAVPTDRGLHRHPTPTGAGLVVVPGVILGWTWLDPDSVSTDELRLLLAAGGLVVVSAADDYSSLPVLPRLGAHLLAVVAALPWVFGGSAELSAAGMTVVIAVVFAWLSFTNIFNFMDGADGLAGAEGLSIAVGLLVVGGGLAEVSPGAVAIAAGCAGFLLWNWAPARVFLGDSGSIPLGFLLAALLIRTALSGELLVALVLPLYFLVDSGWTLSRRVLKGERFWLPHRQHWYQQAVEGGKTHAAVTGRVLVANTALVGIAFAVSTVSAWFALLAAPTLALTVRGLLKGSPR